MNEEQSTSSPPVPVVVTGEEWDAWVNNPVTKIFRNYLHHRLMGNQRAWVNGSFTHPSGDGTLQMNAGAIASCQLMVELLQLTSDEVNQEMSNE